MSEFLVSIHRVQYESWLELVDKWGYGKAQPRYLYLRDCTCARFPNHMVLQGPHPAGGGFTDSGFLVNASREVVGGVDGINIEKLTDDEP